MGFGTKLGCEASVHSTRNFLNSVGFRMNSLAILKIDFKNAYNMLRRDTILKECAEKIPELYPFVHFCYSESSWLAFGNEVIHSEEGVQQGDPLGPLLFCLS